LIAANVIARALLQGVDQARNRLALRAATSVGFNVRIFGWPRVACEGILEIGNGVVLVSSPSPIQLISGEGATLVVGDEAVLESGATIRARGRVTIGTRVRLGAGCIVDDEGSTEGITIGSGAYVEDGAVLLGGTTVAAGATVLKGAVMAEAASFAPSDLARTIFAPGGAKIDDRVRAVVTRIAPAVELASSDQDLSQIKGWDSLCALRVVVALEKEFGVMLPHDLLAAQPRIESMVTAVVGAQQPREVTHG
jgi:acyl carrier protein/acetyltransferase-like isoleucine patch superfamily enzyme